MKRSNNGSSRFRFGQFEVDVSEGKLFKRGLPVRVENQPLQVLAELVERSGEVVTREEFRAKLWPDGIYVDFDESLNTAIKKLRRALGDSAEASVFIETIPRRGYCFLAPISVVEADVVEPYKAAPGDGDQFTSLATPENHSAKSPFSESTTPGDLLGQGHFPIAWKRGFSVGFIVLLPLVALAGWEVLRWRSHRSPSGNHEAMEIRKLTDTGDVESVTLSPDGRYVIYSRRDGERESLRMRQLGSGGDVEILPPDAVDFVGLAFSPDGNYLYFARSDKDDPGYKSLYVMPALGGPARKLITDIDSPVSFSPNGRRFVFTRGIPTKNQVQVRTANSDGTSDQLLSTMQESAAGYQPGPTWSPDGRTIMVPVYHTAKMLTAALYSIAVEDGRQREIYSTDGYGIGRPLWFPGGDAILATIQERDSQRGQLWMIRLPSSQRQRITNDLSDYDLSPDMTTNGENVVAVEKSQLSNIWVSSLAGSSRLEQITFGDSAMLEAIEIDSGKIVVRGRGELWSMNADGSSSASLAKLNADQICRCGTHVVASVRQGGLQHIVRLDNDGTHAISLASGDLFYPTCSPEGRFVFYVDLSSPQTILRIPIEGGTPVQVAKVPGDGIVGTPDISSDGKFLAFPWEQFIPVPGVHLSVISSTEGTLLKSFKARPGIYGNGCVRWSPGDLALQYIVTRDGVTNLWQQNLSGGSPKPLTKFTSGLIFWFNWSQNGKRLLLARGRVTEDAVLLSLPR